MGIGVNVIGEVINENPELKRKIQDIWSRPGHKEHVIVESPCKYCRTITEGDNCKNCGAPKKL